MRSARNFLRATRNQQRQPNTRPAHLDDILAEQMRRVSATYHRMVHAFKVCYFTLSKNGRLARQCETHTNSQDAAEEDQKGTQRDHASHQL
jgi:hypothetical protein